jgi:hypothetical protein
MSACGLILSPPQSYVVEGEMDQKISAVKIIDQNLNIGTQLDFATKSQALTTAFDAQVDAQVDQAHEIDGQD